MKNIRNYQKIVFAGTMAIAAWLLPAMGRAQTTQTLNGGTQTWDTNHTANWDGTNTWAGGNDNSNIGTNTITVDNSFGQVDANTITFLGNATVSGGAIEKTPYYNYNFQSGPLVSPGDETFINVFNNATVTVNSKVLLSDLGYGNEQAYVNNYGSGNLTFNDIDFAAYTIEPARTSIRRLELQAIGSGHIVLNGNYTTSGGIGGQINFTAGTAGGNYDITSSANFANFGSGNIINEFGGSINIANSTFTASQNVGFGNHDAGLHAINISGAQTIAFSIYDSMKYGNNPDSDGVTTDGTLQVNQTTQNVSTMSGPVNLDGSNIALSAVAGSRLIMSGNLAGNTPEGIVVSGSGTVVLASAGGNGYNEADGNGYVQPTSNVAADLKSGSTTLINNGTNGSAFGSASTTANNPANPGNNTTVISTVNLESGATLGGNGTSAPQVIASGPTSVLAPGDAGQASLGIAPSIATLHLNGGLTEENGLTMNFKLNGDANDSIDFGGADMHLDGQLTINLSGTPSIDLSNGGKFYLLTGYGHGTSGDPDTFVINAPAGYTVVGTGTRVDPLNALTSDYYVQLAATPEPSTWAMMLGGVVLLGFCVRRRMA